MAKKKAIPPGLTPAQAEKQTKEAAKKRQIVIELTEEQLSALTEQWNRLKPAEAAELIFTVGKSPTSRMKVAGYSYHGNSCCV